MESGRFRKISEDFVCDNCGFEARGSGYTDHCPKCLYSKHVDINPGDRKSECNGMMQPTSASHDRDGFIIRYQCMKCGMKKSMKAASDDNKEMLNQLFTRGAAFI